MAFSIETLDFLVENTIHDSREWFREHKEQYNRFVSEPFVQFVESLAPYIERIDSRIVCSSRCISRIYRDARYSRGVIFRDELWCSFYRDNQRNIGYPGFYFELSPNGFGYGFGHYNAPASTVECIRELIIAGDGDFERVLKAYQSQDVFVISGQRYKRSKFPDQPEHLKEWLDRKYISFTTYSTDFELFYSDSLADKVGTDLQKLKPMYELFMKAEDIARGRLIG